jgi:hypothetical protein
MRVEIIDMGLGEEGPHLGRLGWRSWFHFPQAQVLEDLFDDLLLFNKGNDAHLALASRAGEGVHFNRFSVSALPGSCGNPGMIARSAG